MLHVNTAQDALKAMQHPLCKHWNWIRKEGKHGATLTVFIDDLANDTRIVVTIHERTGNPPTIKEQHLHGYNKTKHVWTIEGLQRNVIAPDRKGWKAIVETVRNYAMETKGVPNPKYISHYPQN